ncbi:MAG TPA: zinc ribbon domain-containing protein [Syntrophales bacterium]|nr:zinc ribbon domain-containing protein [Syntrophales bacterium]HOM07280.1 zinc ribbon domain-containing protein [Syntrophales bacterium]HOO00153.1 zinc ribbon domain-containing protein [Syntrophales bacterium]HPC01338.1 zinc ribbon domain-containing protein [Syntrophales bacterium]HPQ06875.1 zinc ribbon domain-containing protein [Syntrophales bacterium]
MPIYEFYCHKCNTVYNFFSKTVNTEKIPNCPRCGRVRLKRQMSVFAKISRGREGEGEADDLPPIDEARMEKAMSLLAGEAERINEDDPRQAADLMRKLSEATGIHLGPAMEEALRRMERGEDPERIEEEMGDLLEAEEPFLFSPPKTKGRGRREPPKVDETLYDL